MVFAERGALIEAIACTCTIATETLTGDIIIGRDLESMGRGSMWMSGGDAGKNYVV